MKKSLLSQSIATLIGGLALAGAANAAVSFSGGGVGAGAALSTTTATQLDIRSGGIGHIGVIPYFTTQNGNATLLSITNTDATNGKLLKVRFRSAANSDDIFDFSLFLSPSDVWTANISRSEASGNLSFLTTNDKSCTLPFNVNGDFITNRLPAVSPDFPAATQSSWTREGYIEVLNAADVPPTYAPGNTKGAAGVASTGTNPLFTAIKHVGGVAPCATGTSADVINALASNPATPVDAANLGLDTPSGGIYTNATIVNTRNAFVAWSAEPTAIAAVIGGAGATQPPTPGRGRLVFAPQTGAVATFPQGTAASLTADPLLQAGPAGGGITPLEFDFPDLSTPYVNTATITAANGALDAADSASQANELSASLAVASINNDYTTLAGFAGKTDFTFSFPTRRYGVAVSYTGIPGSTTPGAVILENVGNNYFRTGTTTGVTADGNVTLVGRLACVSPGTGVNVNPTAAFNREEGGQTQSGFVISPGGPGATVRFCGEVSVLQFNNPGGVGTLSAEVAVQNITTGFEEGWARISTPGRATGVGTATFGLPILGSAYVQARGPVEQNRSTTFGWTYKHKAVEILRAAPGV